MKILLTITGLSMGGAEHVVVNLADALSARGHQIKIAYLTGEALVLPKNTSIDVIAIGMKGKAGALSAYFKLRKLVKEFKPDVVHSHMVHANLLSRLLRLTVKIPKLVCTAHNTNEGGQLRMLAYRITDKLADISTNVSQEAVDIFIAKGAAKPGRMLALPNGIDVNIFTFNPDARAALRAELGMTGQKMILAVGRLDTQKDYPNLLKSVQLLAQQRDDFKVFIAGDGPLKSELNLQVKALQVEGFVEFLGIRRDVPALVSATDLFVLPSAWEGFGLVVAEAMACERVVVATDCGGVKEVVGSNGFLVKPRDSILLTESLKNALDLSEEAGSAIGRQARRRIIDKFSLDANLNQFLKLYA
ncbi:glycosyltransferase [Marinobacter sp. AL4B]|uniref:glycosyltransferase n=1 Tax=Marinobacter sp. AL4B TaxID=2871173 RepID=UPI001CAA5C52|nr:glycosyltransferase [Marinobacter sp. AL4B]MBZ0333209.1 glycosyltransferase [Marinobacter sp. AL4B]